VYVWVVRLAERKKLPAVFYATGSGREPVREWLKQLDKTPGTDLALALKRKKELMA
jgi:hypothetical protein